MSRELGNHADSKTIPDEIRKPFEIMRAMGEIEAKVALRDYGAATVKLMASLRKSVAPDCLLEGVRPLLPVIVELAQAQ